jgi:choice-of-anchor B domain-containing protein
MKSLLIAAFTAILLISCTKDSSFRIPENAQITSQNDSIQGPMELPFSALCVNGSAGGFACNGFNLVSRIELGTMGASRGNDCWGWTDPATGIEYALMGLDNGTAFIELSDPANPIYLGKVSTQSSASAWRDVKVYNNYAFIVSEAPGHGMQVFDLTKLRNVPSPPTIFSADAWYSEFGNAHNIVINEESGYAYAVGTTTFNGGPHFINIQDPLNPQAAGGYGMDSYSHDAQVVTYNGPDADYTGKEILIGSNENEVVIADITDKQNPVGIATISYSQSGYTHQGWFTEDHRYFILGDELDELDFGFNTRTLVFDFGDLDNPVLSTDYFGPSTAIDHNGYVKGNKYYLSSYTRGMSEIDLSGIGSGDLFESGFFDTYVQNNAASFNGAWSVYPYFSSGNIVISDINLGLFIVKRGN